MEGIGVTNYRWIFFSIKKERSWAISKQLIHTVNDKGNSEGNLGNIVTGNLIVTDMHFEERQ